jgi:hypothetical protein
MSGIFEARFVIVGMAVFVIVPVIVGMPMIMFMTMLRTVRVLMPMSFLPMIVTMRFMGMTVIMFVFMMLMAMFLPMRMLTLMLVLMFVSHLGIPFLLLPVNLGFPAFLCRNIHHRDTEFAEFGEYLNQKLFTPRPPRLRGANFRVPVHG